MVRSAAMAAALCLPLALPSPAAAQSAPDTEPLVSALVADFAQAFDSADYETVFAMLPPGIAAHFAKNAGLTMAEFQVQMGKMTAQIMSSVEIVDFNMDMEAAVYGTTPSRDYALIPTSITMVTEDKTIEGQSQTVALSENGSWYLLRVDTSEQRSLLYELYSDFNGIDIPEGKMEITTQGQ
ncbi:hypothetical protein IV417_14480 [Alphaproteobacteria bacterium KMM 3653]|uniref:Uncharacterized protein n=1 Tax=Harenicola maris TaxID=2841044 RepID=A0AAP2CVS4_9RHOB|nr:hypothetical protein [Harenicola maris]